MIATVVFGEHDVEKLALAWLKSQGIDVTDAKVSFGYSADTNVSVELKREVDETDNCQHGVPQRTYCSLCNGGPE